MILVKPALRHYKGVMEADKSYEQVGEEAYCGVTGRAGYAAWLIMIGRQARTSAVSYGMNPNEIYIMSDELEQTVFGYGQLRPIDTQDVLTWAGHIGYSVAPPFRGRGYATQMLGMLLAMAYARGLEQVILTCDTDNEASRRVIEKCGGTFDGYYRVPPFDKRVYWFTAPQHKEDHHGKSIDQRI